MAKDRYRILCVQWIDTISDDAWAGEDHAEEVLAYTPQIRSVGIEHSRNDEALLLAQSLDVGINGRIGLAGLLRIPIPAIVHEIRLGDMDDDGVRDRQRRKLK